MKNTTSTISSTNTTNMSTGNTLVHTIALPIATTGNTILQAWPGGYTAFFNGGINGSTYKIGRATSSDGVTWSKNPSSPVLSPTATWEGTILKDPWPLWVNGVLYLYYAGYRASTNRFQIGLATSTDGGLTFTKNANNPIIANGGAGTVDERRAIFPTVLYDADETDSAKKFKMWYAGRNASDVETIAYAYSADGITWTKFGKVLDLGTAGDFDDAILQPGDVKKIGTTYYLFYSGAEVVGGRNKFQGGLATFTDPEGAYTKQGQNLTTDSGRGANLTANTNLGSKVVTIADTSIFNVNEYVLVASTTASPLLTRVASIDSPTQITLRDAVTANVNTADSGAIRSVFSWSAAPRSVIKKDGHWVMAVTYYQVFSDLPAIGPSAYLRELSGWAYNDNVLPTGSWTVDINAGIALEFGSGTSWDTVSDENFGLLAPTPYFSFPIGSQGNFQLDAIFPNGFSVLTEANDEVLVNYSQ
jgi:hypothetical protein